MSPTHARAPLMILVAGPYRSGTGGDPARIQANVDAMTGTFDALDATILHSIAREVVRELLPVALCT